jgi:hypothetical protein
VNGPTGHAIVIEARGLDGKLYSARADYVFYHSVQDYLKKKRGSAEIPDYIGYCLDGPSAVEINVVDKIKAQDRFLLPLTLKKGRPSESFFRAAAEQVYVAYNGPTPGKTVYESRCAERAKGALFWKAPEN